MKPASYMCATMGAERFTGWRRHRRVGLGRRCPIRWQTALYNVGYSAAAHEVSMVIARITPEYTLKIPDEFRQMIEAGQEVAVSADSQGRLVVTPMEQIRAQLLELSL